MVSLAPDRLTASQSSVLCVAGPPPARVDTAPRHEVGKVTAAHVTEVGQIRQANRLLGSQRSRVAVHIEHTLIHLGSRYKLANFRGQAVS